ncbi:hypothetical protein KO465_04860 [Candidatus Micrarchaeota archaeon]|nr:hypothetical protein [Candidatus Micrarchaeota archaeon]
MLTIRELLDESYATALSKGWWDKTADRSFGDVMTNIHAELSEAWEEYRNGHQFSEIRNESNKPEGIAVELADVLIRIADACEFYSIPLEKALHLKLAYNRTRPYRHGNKKA